MRAGAELGECPVWDDAAGRLLWIDAAPGVLWAYHPGTGATDRTALGAATGSFALRAGAGGLVIAQGSMFSVLGPTWSVGHARPSPLARLPAAGPPAGDARLNDGACDIRGRLWAGTASATGTADAALYRLDPDRSVHVALPGVTTSNGIGWDPTDRRLLYVDTALRRIDVVDVDIDRGELGRRRVFAHVRGGLPDGLAVDVDGGVWAAVWGAGEVRRYRPGGAVDRIVRLPVSQPSSCAFGGPALDDLYVTTARQSLSVDRLRDEHHAGDVFVCRPGVSGVPVHRFAG